MPLGLRLPIFLSSDTVTARFWVMPEGGSIAMERWIIPGDDLPYYSSFAKMDLRFYLSPEGGVDSIVFTPKKDSVYIKLVRHSLDHLRFQPASYGGNPLSFILPAELLYSIKGDGPSFDLSFPYDSVSGIKNRRLIEKALVINGFDIPALQSFPSYYCSYKIGGTVDKYPFAIFLLGLDTAGHVNNIQEFCSTYGAFSDMIYKSLLSAEFSPARYRGQSVPSELYLTVRFFNQLVYPAKVWPPQSDTVSDYPFDFIRLESSLYLDSVVNPAIPSNFPGGRFSLGKYSPSEYNVSVFVRIDTLGRIDSTRFISFILKKQEKSIKEILKRLAFIPARDLYDRRVVFRGELEIAFSNSENIRIRTSWLPRPSADIQR